MGGCAASKFSRDDDPASQSAVFAGSKLQVWRAGPDSAPLCIFGDLSSPKEELKRVIIALDPRQLTVNLGFVHSAKTALGVTLNPWAPPADWRSSVLPGLGFRSDLAISVLLLMPSLDSAPEFCAGAEAGLQGVGFVNFLLAEEWSDAGERLRVCRLDDFFLKGASVVRELFMKEETSADDFRKVVAAGEAGAGGILNLFQDNVGALVAASKKTDDEELPTNRFEASVYRFRAFTHLAVGNGLEEAEIKDSLDRLKTWFSTVTLSSSVNMSPLDECLLLGPNVLVPSSRKVSVLAFSGATKKMCGNGKSITLLSDFAPTSEAASNIVRKHVRDSLKESSPPPEVAKLECKVDLFEGRRVETNCV